MADVADIPPLALGAIAGGTSASRAWEMAVKRLAKRIIEVRTGVTTPLAVNVVYQIPGEHAQPDFVGVRSGRFSRKDLRLLVQVALPPEPTADADAEALDYLNQALALAADFARKEGLINGDLTELQGLVAAL